MAAVSSTTNQQDMNQTPSPSDSAVGDLETMLKEKDTEINYLRETMEQNEQVIFKVRTEKKIKGIFTYDVGLDLDEMTTCWKTFVSWIQELKKHVFYLLENLKKNLCYCDFRSRTPYLKHIIQD